MIYNYFLEKVILPVGDMVNNSSFVKELKVLRQQDSMKEEELICLQKRKLKNILDYAVEYAPYYKKYKEKFDDNPLIFLKQFPILEKDTLRKEIDNLLTKDKTTLIKQSSSGSSGIQTIVYFDRKEQSIQRAYQIRWWEWARYRIGNPILQTGITPKRGILKKIKDILFRTYYLPAFSHTEENVLEALDWASKQKEPVLAGYASSLYVIAQIAKKYNKHIRFKTAISWGDKMFEHYKSTIEEVFSCKVHETYASSEGFMIAAQKDVPYMYIMTSNVYIEIVDDEGNEVADGELGHVLVTKLDSFTMPMIRYKIGDLAIKLPRSEYPKNRNYAYPLLKKVIGRDTDLIKTYTGKYMVVHSFTGIIEHYPELKQYTVIQKDLEGITIQYIPDDNFKSSILDKIKSEILSYLEEDGFYIHFEKVDYIAPTPSGKPQIIQSFLNRA
jgi:phenylacetate-CoA ligase